MVAFLAAGQGSQSPRMLTGWLRRPEHAEDIRIWSDAADVDLIDLGTKAPADLIARTENAQPLLVAQGLLARALVSPTRHDDHQPTIIAGHSVGELVAAALAGSLEPADAVRLAAVRGRAMAAACDQEPTTMAAVVGGDEDHVLQRIADLGLTPANHNGSGQIVAAGAVGAIAALESAPPDGTAVKRLAVAGAFHTAAMAPAVPAFAEAADRTGFADPQHLLLSNADGQPVVTGEELRERLVAQITRPVRWDLCLATIGDHAPDLVVTLPPGKTQAGIVKRQVPGLGVHMINIPRDVDHATAKFTIGVKEYSHAGA